ncbi:mannosyltransferase family protein [Streptomyces sp. NRRL S-340]|uniref:mannosyltransferase family protein n=1 Tax=Streptomyces sp. NRRL S-340 TaxID=1463901 RepID=UPI00055A4BC3|nr:mannosyltransferase family protein [Streptomyces sp. NRRL S-340]
MTTTLPTAETPGTPRTGAPRAPRPAPAEGPVPPGGRRLRRLAGRLTPADLRVLRLYLFTRLGLWLVAYASAWLAPAGAPDRTPATWLSRWERWDWVHYQHIAQYGYFDPFPGVDPLQDNRVAFFPGFPLALRAVHVLVPHWTVAGLLVSLVSGAVAVVALARIAGAGRADGDRSGPRAAAFLLFSPAAVFLAAGYTESLFLALALPAWLAARHRNWPLAALLCAAATTVRISGLFLAAALTVELLIVIRSQRRAGDSSRRSLPRRLRPLGWCLLPAVPAAAYTVYLRARTGDWMAWKHAEERGWYRDFHSPAEAFRHTWRNAFGHLQSTGYAVEFQLELAAMAAGVLLLGVLLVRRRWPEAVFIALNLWALGTSYWYLSVPRATLIWWPLWTGLAHWSLRHRWVKEAYVGVVAPLTAVLAVTFTSGHWTG